MNSHVSADLAAAVDEAARLQAGQRLPEPLASVFVDLLLPPTLARGHLLARGVLAGLGAAAATPRHWTEAGPELTGNLDTVLTLIAGALGRCYGWVNQQGGRIVHNILPVPEHSHAQVGASSAVPLAWHTEDAFHPERADLVLLACVRNPDRIGTRLAGIRDAELSEVDTALLGRPLVAIQPDDSYDERAASRFESVGMATVWSSPEGRCVRYDPSYARILTDDADFHGAYRRLAGAFDDCGITVALAPGDLLILDNTTMVHGRVAFRARYDGTDRWLKRVLVRLPRARPERERREHGYHQQQIGRE